MKLNITQKLITFTCCLVFFVGVSIALFSVYEGREQLLATFEEQSQSMTKILADGVVGDLYFRNQFALHDRVSLTLVHPSIVRIDIFDSDGKLLEAADKRAPGKPVDRSLRLSDSERGRAWRASLKGDLLQVDGPVLLKNGVLAGHLSVSFSSYELDQSARDVFQESAAVTLLLLLLGCVGAVITAKSFTRPIFAMIATAKDIEAGNFATRAQVDAHDEFGHLGNSINSMAAALELGQRNTTRADQDLRQLNTQLEERVRRRTAQLAEAEGNYRQLVQSVQAIVWEADAQTWKFTFVSQAAEAILGYPVSRWLNEDAFLAEHPSSRRSRARYWLLSQTYRRGPRS